MKKVLFIAYQFPPMGGPGVQRSTRFVQYLREFGYDPLVLTITVDDIKKMKSSYDESLLSYIPEDTLIERVPSGISFRLNNALQKLKVYRIFWYLFYPFFWERQSSWPGKTFKKASELIKEHDIALVYTSSGPFSPLLLGLKLKKKLGVKWVADMRDPYTDAYAWSFPSKWHWRLSRYFEKKVLSQSDKLIVNTDEVRKWYVKRGIHSAEKIVTITNGF